MTAFWIAVVFLPLAFGAVTYGVRILRGREEVVSPFVLRLTGVLLLVLPVLAFSSVTTRSLSVHSFTPA